MGRLRRGAWWRWTLGSFTAALLGGCLQASLDLDDLLADGPFPLDLDNVSSVADRESNRVFLLGGYGGGARHSRTWVYEQGRYTVVDDPVGEFSAGVEWAAVAYDEERGHLYRFGGDIDSPPDAEEGSRYVYVNLYRLEDSGWVLMDGDSELSPGYRSGASMVWDSAGQRIVLQGGRIGTEDARGPWVFTEAEGWQLLAPP